MIGGDEDEARISGCQGVRVVSPAARCRLLYSVTAVVVVAEAKAEALGMGRHPLLLLLELVRASGRNNGSRKR
ncbi:hypothetical protein TYRP_016574 [Tyrophagus putrescentiae]|nr:hypothetical protein TYRP_016574 [Tyrophagus putrescentiae]